VRNAAAMEVDLTAVDGIVISHAHADHVGGPRMLLRR
jgi:metal-dependent hydrolase (beta-lactamase superfamily II)